MTAADGELQPARRRRRRLAYAVLGIAVVGVGTIWIGRVPIATRFVDRSLGRYQVPARYRIADLGFGRQRLTDVVIGDPRSPDLVADWIETTTDVGLGGPRITGVRAGHVRLRGRLVGGRLSLGSIDRLLPTPSGAPFSLPAIDLDVADGRLRLMTPNGLVGLAFAGRGRLNDGFRGRVAGVAPRLAIGTCRADAVVGTVALTITRERPTLLGPLRAGRLACGDVTGTQASLRFDVSLGRALDRWQGEAQVALEAVRHPRVSARAVSGRVSFSGDAAATRGSMVLAGRDLRGAPARSAAIGLEGRFRLAASPTFVGHATIGGATVEPAAVARVTAVRDAAAGTPLGPLAVQAAQAMAGAARRFDAAGDVALDRGALAVSRLTLAAASGANATFAGSALLSPVRGTLQVNGRLALGGGGLPAITGTLAQAVPGGAISGVLTAQPYAAGGARLALAPVRFSSAPAGVTRISTTVTLSGPVGQGRVEGLLLPLEARWQAGRLVLNQSCTPLAIRSLAIAGLRLDPARLVLCPLDGGLLRLVDGRIGGGMRIAAPRLAGALGTSPVQLAAGGAELRLADRGFSLTGVAARLGEPARATRLDLARVDGRLAGGIVAGRFAGGAGQIGNVPLLLSEAAGSWRLADGRLVLAGDLSVADAERTDPRFQPLVARRVSLTLADGAIAATGVLQEPTTGTKVADVTIDHALSSGRGEATLGVPGLTFRDGFQPDLLTRATFGVIADVKGGVSGSGRIAWSPQAVTSTGDFATEGIDLAAAFGPVTGLAGRIHFTDLLALESAPGQVATVKSINPGIAVTDGRIVYQTLPATRVRVEGGQWPFAGGTLRLEPTLLDFSAEKERRMTFTVVGMDARAFLQQFDFGNLDATGTFDGTLPMIFDQSGGRIEDGRLAVRAGGGTIAYVGDLTQKDLGTWANIAFQALKSLRYRSLDLRMNGPLAGEMITDVRFAGISQGEGARSNFLVRRLQRLPFVFNVRIKAPFRGLLDSVASFYDPKRLVQRNLQQLLDEQNRRAAPAAPVQPPASEKVP